GESLPTFLLLRKLEIAEDVAAGKKPNERWNPIKAPIWSGDFRSQTTACVIPNAHGLVAAATEELTIRTKRQREHAGVSKLRCSEPQICAGRDRITVSV